MAINKFMLAALRALSYPDFDIKQNYLVDRTFNAIVHPSIKALNRSADFVLNASGTNLECALFLPERIISDEIIIFFHGGGWVTGDINSYSLACKNLAHFSGRPVIAVDYRRAPENKFPIPVEDCYNSVLALINKSSPVNIFNITQEKLILAGDSAGGNIAAAVSLMAADRGEFRVCRQVLIYPALNNCHNSASPFKSIIENGTDYLLTTKKLGDYMSLYMRDEKDLINPYFAPLLAENLAGQPKTLVITAEFDPLRDEGEAYAERLRKSGCYAENYRLTDALHGFFTLPAKFAHVKIANNIIKTFLDKGI